MTTIIANYRSRPTRRILNMVLEMAIAEAPQDNARTALLSEAYSHIDYTLSNVDGQQPAVGKIKEALVTGHFPYYLGRTISVAVLDRYNFQTGQWRDYLYQDTTPTYNNAERYRFSEPARPVKRREKEEAYSTYISESRYTMSVDDYAKQLDFSHRILVNDDLGAFNNLVQKLGDSCKRFEDWFASALYDNAFSQTALIATGPAYGGTGRLTTANLAIGWNAFLQRTDAQGNPLAIAPKFLVIPPILQLTANQILQSERIAELATNSINPLQGALQIKTDPYIAFAGINIPWYLFAAPADIPAVTFARLQGKTGPELFAKAPDKIPMTPAGGLGAADWQLGSFISGDIEISVEDTIGSRNDSAATWAGITDQNGIYYSSGTMP